QEHRQAMKRVGRLWDRLVGFENLLRAAETACKGKRFRPDIARFHFGLERELWRLHEELRTRTYRPGPYRTFVCRRGTGLRGRHGSPRGDENRLPALATLALLTGGAFARRERGMAPRALKPDHEIPSYRVQPAPRRLRG